MAGSYYSFVRRVRGQRHGRRRRRRHDAADRHVHRELGAAARGQLPARRHLRADDRRHGAPHLLGAGRLRLGRDDLRRADHGRRARRRALAGRQQARLRDVGRIRVRYPTSGRYGASDATVWQALPLRLLGPGLDRGRRDARGPLRPDRRRLRPLGRRAGREVRQPRRYGRGRRRRDAQTVEAEARLPSRSPPGCSSTERTATSSRSISPASAGRTSPPGSSTPAPSSPTRRARGPLRWAGPVLRERDGPHGTLPIGARHDERDHPALVLGRRGLRRLGGVRGHPPHARHGGDDALRLLLHRHGDDPVPLHDGPGLALLRLRAPRRRWPARRWSSATSRTRPGPPGCGP